MKKIGMRFILPIMLGLAIGSISGWYQYEVPVRILNTISSNILAIISLITPLLTLVIVATAISQIKTNRTRFLSKFIGLIALSSLILGAVVLLFSLIIVPSVSFKMNVLETTSYIDPYFKIGLTSFIGIFQAVVIGVFLGYLVDSEGTIMKILNEIQVIIFKFLANIIMPIMPLWIIGSFASTAYADSGVGFLLTDFLLSMIILGLQFTWLAVSYFIVSKRNNIPFKKIKKAGMKIYGFVISIAGMGTGAVLPIIVDEQKKLGFDEQKSSFVTATAFNMPGSLISNIVFAVGVVSMYGIDVSLVQYITFIFVLTISLIIAPAIPGGSFAVVSTTLSPLLGFTPEMITTFGTMYYKQGTSNSATNNAADLYITPFL